MQAQNRDLPTWFTRARSGQLRLPRFQRYEAWGHSEISNMLETVLRGLPIGAALILEVGDEEQFLSRPISGVDNPAERCTEHLLDGQQRLTALWKSLHDLYEDRTYLLWFEEDEDHEGRLVPKIDGIARWERDGRRFPIWVDDPQEVYSRDYIPLRLLRPGETASEIQEWCDAASGGDLKKSRQIESRIRPLRESILTFNMPYLALPVDTPQDVALDVFIKMNTSSVKLTAFDIIVARFEERTGQSLHQFADDLLRQVPILESYVRAQDIILSAGAMREDRPPTQANFHRLDLRYLADSWSELVAGAKWAIEFLESESIYDEERLPTIAVLPVLIALQKAMPQSGDARGNASTLVRKYLWRAFLTHRYDNAVSGRSLQDLRGLIQSVGNGKIDCEAPIFDEEVYALPNDEELKRVGWPKRRDTLARAVLALSLKGGARDFADDERVTRGHLAQREYHHLFPDHLLTGDGQLPSSRSYRALNCALITWNTNRNISAKEPLLYLQDRTNASQLGEDEIRRRLRTHLVPFDQLSVGGYAEISSDQARAERIQDDYSAFLDARAMMLSEPISALCNGYVWPSET